MIALARWGSPRLVGDWALALSITAPIFIFAQLKLRYVVATDVNDEFAWADYIRLRVRSMFIAMLVLLVIVLVAYREAIGLLMLLLALGKGVEGICDLRYGRQQRDHNLKGVSVALVRRALVILLMGGATLWVTRSAIWTAFAVLLAQVTGLALDLHGAPGTAGLAWRNTSHRMATLARRTLPLGFASAIGSLQASVPRFALEAHASREAVGVFSLLAYPYLLGGLVVTAVAGVALPRLAGLAVAGAWGAFRRAVATMCIGGAALGAAGVLVALLLGGPVLHVLYPSSYGAFTREFLWVSIAAGCSWSYLFLGTALEALRSYRYQPWIFGISTVVIAAAAASLVPGHGIVGATWAMIAGSAVEASLLALALIGALVRKSTLSTA